MLYLIGLGLGDATDVTIKGLEIIKKCDTVYLEAYTSILTVGTDVLEKFYGRSIEVADREFLESGAEDILSKAFNKDVALLVVGDPFGATTHTDLVLRAKERNVGVKIIHNASILNAVGCCGLQLYSFGETISIPLWTENWKPNSFYDKLVENMKRGLHTLCLLDIKVKEPTLESITKKKREYMPPKFMQVDEAAQQLLDIIEEKNDELGLTKDSLAVGLARVGSDDQKIIVCTLLQMAKINLGAPLHSLVIPAPKERLHPLEIDYLRQFAFDPENFDNFVKNSQ